MWTMEEKYIYDLTDEYIEHLTSDNEKKQLFKIIDKLSQREKHVVIMRYGLNYNIPLTLEKIGEEFHVTRERIRQIEATALRKIKHFIKSSSIFEEYWKYYEG